MRSNSKVAIVLGGSSGMGKDAAKLLKDGIDVLITGRDAEKLKAAAAELSGAGKIETAVVDLYDDTSVASFMERIKRKTGISGIYSTQQAISRRSRFSITSRTTTSVI